jgi:hypothetical protein
MRFARSFVVVLLALAPVAGCSLINSDITALTFELPTKSYQFSTQMANLPSSFPAVPCGAGQAVMDCCAPPAPLPQPDCTAMPLSCDNSVCTLHQTVSVAQRVNLSMEVPQLQALGNNKMLADVFIKKISYSVVSTLNVDLPPVTIYLAPDGVTSPSDPSAKKFGTVPATPAGATRSGDVALEPDAQQTFSSFATNFTAPFGFIASTTLVVASGSTIPSGNVTVSVMGTISAQPHL